MLTPNPAGKTDYCPAPLVPPWHTIRELAEGLLRSNPYLALKNVSCDYCEGVLTLRGCLPTYYLKQMAQETVARIEGVVHVANEIDVGASARYATCPA